jgi:alkanesulfonate monooxygenase SsuD/methylene tetrahydromethanopterin reductase-like flavin-dependent oxidoreductase (luciferase family)
MVVTFVGAVVWMAPPTRISALPRAARARHVSCCALSTRSPDHPPDHKRSPNRMRLVAMSELALTEGVTHQQRYLEVLDEAVLAEEMGFEAFLVSEHHFNPGVACCSALETYLGALAMRTSRIRLRPAVFVLPLSNPIRLAEQVATLDILSNGRIEFGGGRGNYLVEMEAFGISPKETRGRWEESMKIVTSALADGFVEADGQFYKIPKRDLVPKPVQKPHPPCWGASTSLEGSYLAGQQGVGEMHLSNYLGHEFVGECMAEYRRGLAESTRPIVRQKNRCFSSFVLAHVADTRKQAHDEAREGMVTFSVATCKIAYPMLAKASADYAYMGKSEELSEKVTDMDFLANETAMVVVGDPNDCIAQLRRFEEVGVDEVVLKIDSMPHDVVMRSIRMFGEEVLPHFRRATMPEAGAARAR